MKRSIIYILIATFFYIIFSVLMVWGLDVPKKWGKGQQEIKPIKFWSPAIEEPTNRIIYRLNWCLNWDLGNNLGKNCGKAAADAFCTKYGYKYAISFEAVNSIGHINPTLIMGDNLICNTQYCDGFSFIECAE